MILLSNIPSPNFGSDIVQFTWLIMVLYLRVNDLLLAVNVIPEISAFLCSAVYRGAKDILKSLGNSMQLGIFKTCSGLFLGLSPMIGFL